MQAAVRILPITVIGIVALSLAWLERGSIAAADWLPYACVAGLLLGTIIAAGAAALPSRSALVALVGLVGLALWAALSLTWSPAPSLARDEALLTAFYATAFAIPLFTLRTRVERAVAIGIVAVALVGLALATAVSLILEPDPERTILGGRLVFPVSYVNAQAAITLIGFWPAVAIAASRTVPSVVRALLCGGAAALLGIWLVAQSKGGGIALALSAVLVFALSPGRLRLLLPVTIAAAAPALAFSSLTRPYRVEGELALAHALERAGLAVVLVAVAAGAAGLVYALVDRRLRVSRRIHTLASAAAIVGILAALAVGSAAFLSRVEDPGTWVESKWAAFKFIPTEAEQRESHFLSLGSNRYDFWRVSLGEFERHPVAGIGARGFNAAYLEEGRSSETPARVHSLPLELLLEQGLVGLILLVIGVGIPLVLAARRLPTVPALAALGGGSYWLVHASGDWIWTVPATGVVFFLLLGISASGSSRERPLTGRVALTAGVAVVVLALGAFAPPWLSHRITTQALQTGAPEAAELELARRLDPLSIFPLTAKAALADSPAEAIAPLEQAAELEPRSVGVQYLLGRAYLDAGRKDDARRQFRIAHRLYPRDELIARALERAR